MRENDKAGRQEAGGRAASRRRRPAAAQGGEDAARRLQRLGLPLSQRRSRHQQAVPRRARRQAARPHQPARRGLLGGADLQRPPLAALPAGRATTRSVPSLIVLYPARPGRHAGARRRGAPGSAAADCRDRDRTWRWWRRSSPLDAADSSAGNFWRPGHFAAYIDEAAERLMRLYGDRRGRPHLQLSAGGGRGLQRRLSLGRLRARRAAARPIASRASS